MEILSPSRRPTGAARRACGRRCTARSRDGRIVVAAYDDGTIRWHRLDDGRELLAFMVLSDRSKGGRRRREPSALGSGRDQQGGRGVELVHDLPRRLPNEKRCPDDLELFAGAWLFAAAHPQDPGRAGEVDRSGRRHQPIPGRAGKGALGRQLATLPAGRARDLGPSPHSGERAGPLDRGALSAATTAHPPRAVWRVRNTLGTPRRRPWVTIVSRKP
jgi:hypothetical protein